MSRWNFSLSFIGKFSSLRDFSPSVVSVHTLGDCIRAICFILCQTLKYSMIISSKHKHVSDNKITTGCSMRLRMPVVLGDHPRKASHHLCSPSFFTRSKTRCISSVSWWTVIKVLCPSSRARSSHWRRSSCCKNFFHQCEIPPNGSKQ